MTVLDKSVCGRYSASVRDQRRDMRSVAMLVLRIHLYAVNCTWCWPPAANSFILSLNTNTLCTLFTYLILIRIISCTSRFWQKCQRGRRKQIVGVLLCCQKRADDLIEVHVLEKASSSSRNLFSVTDCLQTSFTLVTRLERATCSSSTSSLFDSSSISSVFIPEQEDSRSLSLYIRPSRSHSQGRHKFEKK